MNDGPGIYDLFTGDQPRPTLGAISRGRSTPTRGRWLCGRCVDNVAQYDLTIVTKNESTTGPIPTCWPCLTDRLEDIKHDLDAAMFGGPVQLGHVTEFHVKAMR